MERKTDEYGVEWRCITVGSIDVWVSAKGWIQYTYVNKKGETISVLTKGQAGTNNYLHTRIDGKSYCISRLVANAFLYQDLPLRKPSVKYSQIVDSNLKIEVDHINGDRTNNSVDNLRLVRDRKSNCNTAESKKRYSSANKKLSRFGIKGYQCADRQGNMLKEFIGDTVWDDIMAYMADEMDVHTTLESLRTSIHGVCRGKGKTAYGLVWTRLMDETFVHHKYYDYQREYHKAWVKRQKAAASDKKKQ